MPVAWRVVRSRHANSAFDGEGARIYGGRWNSPGVAVVYASAHLSLAALEILVHMQPLTPLDVFTVFSITWDDALTDTLASSTLGKNWDVEPPGQQTMRLGDEWARKGQGPVLAVPSAILPEESNYLFNPRHKSFAKLEIKQARELVLDARLTTKLR